MADVVTDESIPNLPDTISTAISPRDEPTRECCDRAPGSQLLKAFAQFNRGEYWEQHETLEEIWRAETETSLRNFYKGIIQVGVGFYHLSEDNYRGVMKVLARGITYLKPYAPECCRVDVARLVQEASVVYHRAEALGPGRLKEIPLESLPKIHLVMPKHD
jgi:predicted metal-dependent hydrolase